MQIMAGCMVPHMLTDTFKLVWNKYCVTPLYIDGM